MAGVGEGIRKRRPEAKVLMLTIYDDEDIVSRCMEAGACGYLLKDAPPPQLVYAIQAAAHDQQQHAQLKMAGQREAHEGEAHE